MKVYRVEASYFDGGHESGLFRSPVFMHKLDAEAFLAAVKAADGDYSRNWCSAWSDVSYADVIECEALDAWDGELLPSKNYLRICHT